VEVTWLFSVHLTFFVQVMETEVKSVAPCILRFSRIRPRNKVNGLVETRLHMLLWIVINHPV